MPLGSFGSSSSNLFSFRTKELILRAILHQVLPQPETPPILNILSKAIEQVFHHCISEYILTTDKRRERSCVYWTDAILRGFYLANALTINHPLICDPFSFFHRKILAAQHGSIFYEGVRHRNCKSLYRDSRSESRLSIREAISNLVWFLKRHLVRNLCPFQQEKHCFEIALYGTSVLFDLAIFRGQHFWETQKVPLQLE